MTTIHLTDAQRDTFAACGLIVIDGELRDDANPEQCRQCNTLPCAEHAVAPEGWRILTEPCDTCAGSGVQHWDTSDDCDHACSACDRGRRTVTLTATCPTCAGDPYPCWKCRNKSVVELGRFTIPALWQVDRSTDPLDDDFIRKLVSIFPLPRPGQFIARPERVG